MEIRNLDGFFDDALEVLVEERFRSLYREDVEKYEDRDREIDDESERLVLVARNSPYRLQGAAAQGCTVGRSKRGHGYSLG